MFQKVVSYLPPAHVRMIPRETWSFFYLVNIQTSNEGLIGLSCICNRGRYFSLSFLFNQQNLDSFQNNWFLNAQE